MDESIDRVFSIPSIDKRECEYPPAFMGLAEEAGGAYKDQDRELLLLRSQQVEIQQQEAGYHLKAIAQGERLDRNRPHQGVDVKAVTLHQFHLGRADSG